jgi:hypothetical protein
MPTLSARLDAVRRLPVWLALAALDAALPLAGEDEQRAIIAELLALAERPAGPGMAGLAAAFRCWPALAVEGRVGLAGWCGGACSVHVEALLSCEDAQSRRTGSMIAADLVLLRLNPESPLRGRVEPGFDRALARAAGLFGEHRLRVVLDALLAVADDPGPAAREFLSGEGHEAHWPLRAAARAAAADARVATLVRWLGLPALAPVAREAIERRAAASPTDDALVLCLGTGGRAARRLKQPDRFVPTAEEFASLDEPTRRGVIRLLRALGVSRGRVMEVLHGCLTDPAPRVRLDAARALACAPATPEGDELLRDFALDAYAAPAAAAASALARVETAARRKSLAHFFGTLGRSPHAEVRRIAAAAVRRLGRVRVKRRRGVREGGVAR